MNESEFANYNYAGMICNGLRLHVYPDKIIENCSRKTLTAEEVLKLKDYQVCKFKSCNVGMCLNYFNKYNVKYLKNINFNCITPQIDDAVIKLSEDKIKDIAKRMYIVK